MEAALKRVLRVLAAGGALSEAEAEGAFGLVMDGQASPAQIAALLTALHVRCWMAWRHRSTYVA